METDKLESVLKAILTEIRYDTDSHNLPIKDCEWCGRRCRRDDLYGCNGEYICDPCLASYEYSQG